MFRNMGISWRLAISVAIGAALILGAVIGTGYILARQILEKELAEKASLMVRATTARIEGVESSVRKVAEGTSGLMRIDAPGGPEKLYLMLDNLVRKNDEIYGAAVALEPAAYGYSSAYLSPYVFRSWNQTVREDLALRKNPYFVEDWYALPKMMGRAVWSEPYRSEARGNALMVTYSTPLHSQQGNFLGVVTCDISLEWLTDMLQSLPLGKGGFAFLLSQNGTFISHPDRELILKENIFSQAEEQDNPALRVLGREMVKGKSGFIPSGTVQKGKEGWILFQPIQGTGWSIGAYFPEAELMEKLAELSRQEGMIGAVGFLLLLPMVLLISRSITRPLRSLTEATRLMAGGELETPLPIPTGRDEVSRLSGDFRVMQQKLKQHIEMNRQAAATQERIESELRIAHSIQMGLLPKDFPSRSDFDLFAAITPAREVGGDFYDFMMPDENHLWLMIGDVSGKGTPAALFMAVTLTYLRAFVRGESSPAAVLGRVNDELARNNETSMFVTVFCAIVHLPSGRCRIANGGHNPPVIVGANGKTTFIPKLKGAMLGAREGLVFEESEMNLNVGDVLFLYTDGVTEALDAAEKFFGNERLLEKLTVLKGKTSTEIIAGVSEAIAGFTAGMQQYDDIAMAVFQKTDRE